MAGDSDRSRLPDSDREGLGRSLFWIGIGIGVAGIGAAIALGLLRTAAHAKRLASDPTSQRIQQLIEEANALLKTLEEQHRSSA